MNSFSWDSDPLYFIFKNDVPGFIKMHTKLLDFKDWIKIDKSYLQQMPLRYSIMKEYYNDIFISSDLESTKEAKKELLDIIIKHLETYFPDKFHFIKDKKGIIQYIQTPLEKIYIDNSIDPLFIISQLVQEDWCIMELDKETNEYKLTAGILCFPMGWTLKSKYNKSLGNIHKPVKDFKLHLQENVESIFSSLQCNKPLWRANWVISNDLNGPLDLYSPISHRHIDNNKYISKFGPNTGKELVLRVEYQTLRRLPKSNAIIFGIRTYQRYLEEFKYLPKEDSIGLLNAIEYMEDNMFKYKGANTWKDATIQYLTNIINSSRL